MNIVNSNVLSKILDNNKTSILQQFENYGFDSSVLELDFNHFFLYYFILQYNLFGIQSGFIEVEISNSSYYWINLFGLKNPSFDTSDFRFRLHSCIEVKNEEEWNLLHNNFNPDIELF